MRTITVTELQNNLDEVLHFLDAGEEIQLKRKNRVIARMTPSKPDSTKIPWPDFAARARKAVGKRKGKKASEIVIEDREERAG